MSNEMLGMGLFLFTELTLFSGLMAAYVILHSAYRNWPPIGEPDLPVTLAAYSTVLLAGSALAFGLVQGAVARGDKAATLKYLGLSLMGGAGFIGLHVYDWTQLLALGLTPSSSVYGAIYYTVIGIYLAHVLVTVGLIGRVTLQASSGIYTTESSDGLMALRAYWLFLASLWPFFFGMVYLW